MGDLAIPERLAATSVAWEGDLARAWLADLPRTVAEVAAAWDLEVGPPFEPGGNISWVAPVVRRRDGADLVLKVQFPHPESSPEAPALAAWAGEGAAADPVAALDAGLHLAAALHRATPPAGVPTVADARAERVDQLGPRRRLVPDLSPVAVDLAVDVLRSGGAPERDVLLHGDLNPTNVLRSERGWLAIDPKPMVGDPALDAARLVLQLDLTEGPDPSTAFGARCDRAAEVLAVPRGAVVRWCVADLVEHITWHASMGDEAEGRRLLGVLAWVLPHTA